MRYHSEPILVVPDMICVELAKLKVAEESGGALADLDQGNLSTWAGIVAGPKLHDEVSVVVSRANS